jgi:hypothetical protein
VGRDCCEAVQSICRLGLRGGFRLLFMFWAWNGRCSLLVGCRVSFVTAMVLILSKRGGGGGAHYFGFGFPHEFVAELGIPLEWLFRQRILSTKYCFLLRRFECCFQNYKHML